MKARQGGIVYSTHHGAMCPTCRKPVAACACRAAPGMPAGDGIVRVGRETKGRKGKGVTIITGVPLHGPALEALGSQLKKRCGSGGTVKDGTIEIQGDHRDLVVAELEKLAWKVKRTGG